MSNLSRIIYLWAAAVIGVIGSSISVTACPTECSCVNKTVNCRDPAMTSFPAGVPPDTEVLEIKGSYSHRSQFHHLTGSDLSGFTSLNSLIISYTSLDSVDEDAFKGLNQLKSIDLSFNRLTNLPQAVFNDLISLVILYLTGNENLYMPSSLFDGAHNLMQLSLGELGLERLDLQLFKPLNSLNSLDLSNNRLKRLPSGMSQSGFLTALQNLDLRYNAFETLSNDTAPLLRRVAKVWLGDNPWRCNCDLKWLQQFRSHIFHDVGGDKMVVCESPPEVAFRPLALLSQDQMICIPPRIVTCSSVEPQKEGSTFHIRCEMTGEPFPLVSWKTPDGETTLGSAGETVSPFLDLQPPQVTISLMANKATNGTIIIMAQNGYGVGTQNISVFVKPADLTTSTTTTTTTTTTATATIPTVPNKSPSEGIGPTTGEKSEETKEKEKDDGGGNNMIIYIAAGAGGGVLLLTSITVGLACRKLNKDKVKPLKPQPGKGKKSKGGNKSDNNNKGDKKKVAKDQFKNDDYYEEMKYTRKKVSGMRDARDPGFPSHPISAWDL